MPRSEKTPEIRAAGGVVWQPRTRDVAVALVHRPRYDDWSLPKGKLGEGEPPLAAAVREVGEELGSQVAVSRRIRDVTYQVDGARKTVTYWAMRHLSGSFTAGDEVDAVEWLPPAEARRRLSYDADRRVLADFAGMPLPDSVILLVRHAKAGKRGAWRGDDNERPLEPVGLGQAKRLVELVAPFTPNRVVSAEPVRCVQTVQPLADRFGLPVRVDPVFGDASFERNPSGAEDALVALGKPGKVTVVCSQGTTIPALIDRLSRGTREPETKKGAFWALSLVDGNVVSLDYYDDAIR